MASWAATSIRRRYPEAFLCWAVEARCSAVIDRGSLVTRAWEFPRDRWKRARWSPRTWAEQVASYSRLRQLKLDVGIDLQGHSKTALCLRLSGAKRRIMAQATDSFAARLNPVAGPRTGGLHTVEWNQRVVQMVDDLPLPEAPIMPYREKCLASVRERLTSGKRLATISVSAGHPTKAYPLEGWREVGAALMREGYEVAFLGGPGDPAVELAGSVDFVGKLALQETLAAVQLSDLHLAADTGTGHMAAACGIPVVSVFGPTEPTQYRPYTKNGIVLRDGEETARVRPERILRAASELVRREDAALPD